MISHDIGMTLKRDVCRLRVSPCAILLTFRSVGGGAEGDRPLGAPTVMARGDGCQNGTELVRRLRPSEREGALMTTQLLDRSSGSPDRSTVPLYTLKEAARYLDVPESTLATWAKGYRREFRDRSPVAMGPVLTSVSRVSPRGPVIPFVGLAEGLVLSAMRRSGVPLQRIRPALARLDDEFGLSHALASRRLFTDGAEVLYDYAETTADAEASRAVRELVVVVRSNQRVFNDVVESYLQRVEFDDAGYVRLIRLPVYTIANVLVDPARGFGQPIFARGGARIEDALAMFRAGEPLDVVADEFGVPREELEDAVRISTRVAA